MPFLGKSPKAGNYILLDSITTSATATYNLTRNSTAYFPASARNLIVSLNGITQAPDTAYSVSGSTITFSSALTSSDVIDYILVLGDVLSIGTPADNTVGIDQLNVSDGTSGQALTTDGFGTLSFSTISSSTPTLDAVTGAGATTTNAVTVGSFTSTGIDDNANQSALVLDSVGYATLKHSQQTTNEGLTLQNLNTNLSVGTAINFELPSVGTGTVASIDYQNTGNAGNFDLNLGVGSISSRVSDITLNSSGEVIFSTFTTERMRIDSSGDTQIANQLYFGSNLGDVISLYDDRLGNASMYGFGVEGSTLFSRSYSLFNWYVNQTNDGSSYAMQLNGNGRLTLKGSQNASNAAQVYFIDDGSPGLVGGIEFTGTFGNGGGYHSSLQTSGELQYSAAGHFFADTSATSSGIPIFWCRMNSDMTIGTFTGSTILTEYLFDVSAGDLHIDGALYQNSSSTNSDSKMKENVVTLTDCLNKVSQLRGVEFDWKNEYVREAYHDVGLIAQEVESVIPEVVSEHEIKVGKKAGTEETLKSVDYSRLTAVLIEAVKELKTQNEALETRIAALEAN